MKFHSDHYQPQLSVAPVIYEESLVFKWAFAGGGGKKKKEKEGDETGMLVFKLVAWIWLSCLFLHFLVC